MKQNTLDNKLNKLSRRIYMGENRYRGGESTEFLNRFEGRTSSIGRAGLMSILDRHVSPSCMRPLSTNRQKP